VVACANSGEVQGGVARCRRGAVEVLVERLTTWWGELHAAMTVGEYCCGDLSLNGLVEMKVRKMVSDEAVVVQGGALHQLKVTEAFGG